MRWVCEEYWHFPQGIDLNATTPLRPSKAMTFTFDCGWRAVAVDSCSQGNKSDEKNGIRSRWSSHYLS